MPHAPWPQSKKIERVLLPNRTSALDEKWTLKQVQGDDYGWGAARV